MFLHNMKQKDFSLKSIVRNDIILIVGLLLVSAIGMFYLFIFRKNGDTVKVTVDGKTYATYSLSENITKDIYSGENNEHLNRLIIEDGKAYIETATCPDGICVDHSPIFRDGESIVCLPQHVVISIITNSVGDNLDVII